MSYDLFFCKPKGKSLSEEQIGNYLSQNLVAKGEDGNQWFYTNEDTGVYYLFDHDEPDNDPESMELYESFEDFDNTHFSFNLNFMRPSFFGLHISPFVWGKRVFP